MARRAGSTIAGAPGDFLDFAGNVIPKWLGANPQLPGVAPGTSEGISKGLERAGWKDPSAEHPIASQYGSVIGAVTPVAPIVDAAVVRPLGNAFTRAGRLTGEADQAVQGAARSGQQAIVGQHPMPEQVSNLPPVVDVKPQYPGPRADPAVPVSPIEPKPVARTAPQSLSQQLEGHITENADRISAEKKQVWDAYKAENPPKGIDLEDFKADLTQRIARAGTDEEETALRKVLNRVNKIEGESDTQFDSLHKLRRKISEQAKFGETPSGYEAIGLDQARDLSKALGERMKFEHPPYADFAEDYSALGREAKPIGAGYLSELGKTEGADNMLGKALQSPKNVENTIEAMGPGGAQKLDALAVHHVENALGRKSGQELQDAWTNLQPSLAKLPEARKRADELLKTKEMDQAHKGIVDAMMERHANDSAGAAGDWSAQARGAEAEAAAKNKAALASQKASTDFALNAQRAGTEAANRAENIASSYRKPLNILQTNLPPAKRLSTLQSMVSQMKDDGLISDAQHLAFSHQLTDAMNAADKQKKLEMVSKYVAYALTGSYMLSFGGLHAAQLLTHP